MLLDFSWFILRGTKKTYLELLDPVLMTLLFLLVVIWLTLEQCDQKRGVRWGSCGTQRVTPLCIRQADMLLAA